jgi:peptide-methionine (S)-S-oxide reductase
VFPDGPRDAGGLRYASIPLRRVLSSFLSMDSKASSTRFIVVVLSLRERIDNMTTSTSTDRAVLAGGCFWGMQDLLRRYPGVIATRVGYTGGETPNATYRNHGNHAEAIEIVFDPKTISYRKILEYFFQIHDPTTLNRQGNDKGASYRSAIFYTNDDQKRIAEDTIADVNASGLWPGKVVTEVTPVGPFWEAEPEHQDYLERLPNGYTCHFIRPGWTLHARAS